MEKLIIKTYDSHLKRETEILVETSDEVEIYDGEMPEDFWAFLEHESFSCSQESYECDQCGDADLISTYKTEDQNLITHIMLYFYKLRNPKTSWNHRINRERFSVRFCNIADKHGFKTVGSFEKALKANPAEKWTFRGHSLRANRLLTEIKQFKDKTYEKEILQRADG